MKQYFFLLVLAIIAFAFVGWFAWTVIRALHTLVSDWRLGRELNALEAECAERRRARQAGEGAALTTGERSRAGDAGP